MRGASRAIVRSAAGRMLPVLALTGLAMLAAPSAHAGSCADGARQTLTRSWRLEESGSSAVTSSRDCSTARTTQPRKRSARDARRGQSYVSNGTMVYCVRPRDGYFFPTPHSQFGGEKDMATTIDMCRAICADPAMDVYALHDPSLETDSMVSLTSGVPYLELNAAHAFREQADFKGCDMQRYFRALDRARAKAVKPGDLGDTIIPTPTARPDRVATAATQQAPARRPPTLRVRDVGPVYLPE
jgi:hypothetical protein